MSPDHNIMSQALSFNDLEPVFKLHKNNTDQIKPDFR